MPATSLRQWLGTAAEPIVIDLISDDEEEAFNMVRTQRSLKAGSSTPSFAQAPAPARKASAPGTATIAIPTAQFITGARRAAAHALSSAPVSSSSSYIPSSRLSLRASTRPVTPAIPAMPATPATAPPTPGPSTTRTRKRQRIVTTLGPFAPAPVPGPEGVTLNDMLAESHRRLHPGGIVCPLRIGDEDCEAILATPQILLMHIGKHVARLREADPQPPVYWIEEGIPSDAYDADALEGYASTGCEQIKRSVCPFAGCSVPFTNGHGRTQHLNSRHPPPYSYDQLRPLNLPLLPARTSASPSPSPPPLPKEVSSWQLVTPVVRAVPPDPGNPVKYETKVYPIGRIVDYPFIMSGERYEANDSSSFIYQPHRHGEDEDEDGDGVESHANVSHSQRSQPATQIPRKHRPPARRGKGTAQTTGEQAQRVRALSAEPQISPTGYRYFEPMMASPEALAEVNLRSNAQDVILQNLQRGDAEIMRKQGEEPPRILQLPGKSSAARAAMAAGEAANGEAAAPPASAPPDSAMPASSFASAAPSAPASSMPETPTPAPDTTPGPAVAAKRRKKTRTETQAGEKAAHEAQEAERARNRLIENAAGRYAFKKTGAWVGYDEFYTHQQKAIAHQNKLDQAAAAAKAGRQAQAEPAK